MQSMQAQYALEREGIFTVEKDCYFFTYKVVENEFHVFDSFVLPDFRSADIVKKMTDEIESLAISKNLKYIVAHVYLVDKNKEKSLKMQFRAGMKIHALKNDSIVLVKAING